MNAEKLRVLIAEDEAPARRHIERLLAREPDVTIVASCRNAREAMNAEADVAFVDIEMPGRSGLDLAFELRHRGVKVVFVTAFAEHAPAAFDLDAADYLLKPFDGERLKRALDRVRRELDARPQPAPRPASRLAVEVDGRVRLVAVSAIDWIEADGRQVVLHIGLESVPHRETMRAVEARLDPEHFARIHRGAIVRIAAIREMWPAFHGDWVVALESGEQLVMSRRYRRLREAFGVR